MRKQEKHRQAQARRKTDVTFRVSCTTLGFLRGSSKKDGKRFMRSFIAAGVIVATIVLAACGSSSSTGAATSSTTTSGGGSATITLGFGQFSGSTSVTIKAGQTVTFDDSQGGPHHLLTGSNGTFTAQTGAPSEFGSNGTMFAGGDTKTVTFATAGTYMITCTFHPSMEATVTVTP
jgi:plastocyanin